MSASSPVPPLSVPDDPTCIERYWFAPMCERPRQYINSAHLIVTRTLFDRVGGFDETPANR